MATRCLFHSAAILLFALVPFTVWGGPVDAERAERVARNFWNNYRDKDVAAQTEPMRCANLRWDALYIFESTVTDGFVIVSADDRVQPILAYSFHNKVGSDNMSPELAWWLDGYQQQIALWRDEDEKTEPDVANTWSGLENGEATSKDYHPSKRVDPMITTQWDQGSPYNLLCPTSTDGRNRRAVTGCVATAMAQVMKYWEYPVHGTGSHSYTPFHFSGNSLFGPQTVDFSAATYDWNNMPNRLTSANSDAEKQAVALLMYHCGVAVEMEYGTSEQGGSGAYLQPVPYLDIANTLTGMIKYLGYSSNATAVSRAKYDGATWINMMREELRAGRPIIYAGGDASGGHCFICDGYGNMGYYHFNWGWSGIGDGDYILENLAPGSGGIGGGSYNFTQNQEMLIGVQPPVEDDSLCIIRQFPYAQDFEMAATCWTAEGTRLGHSWRQGDAEGVDGFYSACIVAPNQGNSDDHLYTPYICTPGQYKISWQARSYAGMSTEYYTVSADSQQQISDTLYDGNWVDRELFFEVRHGDTLRIDFHYTSDGNSSGIMVDNMLIELIAPSSITNCRNPETSCHLHPNPTRGIVHIESGEPILRVELLDISGRRMLTDSTPTINFTNLPAGIYILRVTTPSGTDTQRIMRMH